MEASCLMLILRWTTGLSYLQYGHYDVEMTVTSTDDGSGYTEEPAKPLPRSGVGATEIITKV
jgi:hypothetical protein